MSKDAERKDNMVDYIRNNIDTIISVLALSLTLWQYISGLIKRRENYKVKIDNVQTAQTGRKNFVLLSMTILNNSASNLNITRMYLVEKKQQFLCHIKKSWCGERYYPQFPETDLPRTERIFSSEFPLNIQQNGANNVLVKFETDSLIEIKKHDQVTLKILTNKKESVVKVVCLDDKKDLTYL